MASWAFDEGDEIAPGRTAVRLLGGGRRYEAYVVWDERLLALAVAKIVRPEQVDDPGARKAFEAESLALEHLHHPSLVRAFDAVLEGERPHLLLELVQGPRLSTLIRRYGLALEQVLPLALELCSAVHYLGIEGYVHLDVKPRNVVLSARPILIDLSVARTLEQLRTVSSSIGTDAYMAPEQCDPGRFDLIGPPADVWGIGVTLYEAIARQRPFPDTAEEGTLAERYPQTALEPERLPGRVPAPLAATILSCLAYEPDERPTAAELAAALEPLVASLPRPRLGLFRPGSTRRSRAVASTAWESP
jgi:serine/threonine protein kinase